MNIGAEILLACSSMVNIETMNALVQTESNYNPYAIAIVNGDPIKQPQTLEEAQNAIDLLELEGVNYSVGLGQVNKANFEKYGTNGKRLLEPCHNIKISEKILAQCYNNNPNKSVAEALSCYYAGNYYYGFVKEKVGKNRTAYIERIINNFEPVENIVPSLDSEIPQALAKVREPRKKKQQNKSSNGVVTLTAKEKPLANSSGKLIKNVPLMTVEQNQSSSSTFKF